MTFVLRILFLLSLLQGPSFAVIDPIENIVDSLYEAWNKHDIDKVMSFYAKDFATGDGIKQEDYKLMTESLWKSYPDIKIENQKKNIRSQDQYSSVALVDFFYGQSKDQNIEIKEKGILNAISQGQIFLQKFGNEWKIISDRVQFELVTVYYGNAKKYLDDHQIYFSSPEQVKAGDQYSATLYAVLPDDIKATASISKELIRKPEEKIHEESFQAITEHKLERLFQANDLTHNELASATILLSKGLIEPKLDGILYICKRINVVPNIDPPNNAYMIDKAFASTKVNQTTVENAPKIDN